MLSAVHTLTSLPFGVLLEHPVAAFLAAAAFHLLADTVLHWNIYVERYPSYPYHLVGLDLVSGVVAAYLLLGQKIAEPTIIAAIIGGNFPDIANGLWDKLPARGRTATPLAHLFAWHDRLQNETDNVARGLVSQIALITASMAILWLTRTA